MNTLAQCRRGPLAPVNVASSSARVSVSARPAGAFVRSIPTVRRGRPATHVVQAEETPQDRIAKYGYNKNKEFGYSRKDVILICVVLFAAGYGSYYGLQYGLGMDAGMAGNYTQFGFTMLLCLGWVGSYVFRVGTKNMSYMQQLNDYEEAVMEKRLEELTDDEMERMLEEVEDERVVRRAKVNEVRKELGMEPNPEPTETKA